MRRPSRPSATILLVHVALALLVPFAPSIHLLSPHRHDSSSCSHGPGRVHFEGLAGESDDAPCPVCAHLLNRPVLSVPIAVRYERNVTRAEDPAPLATCQARPALQDSDDRGPPLSL